ncbi:MAG: hypothetical protein JXB49_22060 [Bacteroidales bacterium]|nr:hypothetical protein [Bacteroidales bacterium]
MKKLKITSWNIEHLDRLVTTTSTSLLKRKQGIQLEIERLNSDIICLLEGPNGETKIETVAREVFNDQYLPVKASNGQYKQNGTQWIWFLVRQELIGQCSLLPVDTWSEFTGGISWNVNYWGNFDTEMHKHYRHPQVLIFEFEGNRIEFIGLHLKSKFVNQGESMWGAGSSKRQEFIKEALKARIKMTTEATNVRKYIDRKFEQLRDPAIFVLGDFNDGPGKEFFENQYLFFDLISNIQGNIFEAHKFLNHALFDFPDALRWSVFFKDFIEPQRDPRILLDHIMFTQPLTNWNLNVCVEPKSGFIEHEVHDEINASLTSTQKTSDHKPISVVLSVRD